MIKRLQDRLETARNNENGFTLIELLIVIVVLGILAGIVVLGLGSFRKDSTQAACKADAKTIEVASDAFMASPSNPNPGTPAANVAALVTAKLLKAEPTAVYYTAASPKITYNAGTGAVTETCNTIT